MLIQNIDTSNHIELRQLETEKDEKVTEIAKIDQRLADLYLRVKIILLK
jgi:hypothetical protein